jgi:N-acetylmuramoyl-L-alanine amidase
MMKKSLILKYFGLILILIIGFKFSYAAKLRYSDHSDFTRVVIESGKILKYDIRKTDEGIRIRIRPKVEMILETRKESNRLSFLGVNKGGDYTELIFSIKKDYDIKTFTLNSPFRIVIDFFNKKEGNTKTPVVKKQVDIKKKEEAKKDNNTAIKNNKTNNNGNGVNSKKEIRTIVIDPGHGGTEYGAKGPSGTYEKDITLKIARVLKTYIENYIGLKVFLTRNSDMNLSLEERASIANNQKADIFISIHCNASRSRKAKGSETFILSLKATDKEARRLAFYENNFEEMNDDNREADDIKLILWDMAQTEYLRESANLAILIQKELNILLGTKNRGIKQAPFRVLMNVAMPAVLVEAAFISNPSEEKMLNKEQYQKKIAYAIFLGIKRYLIQNR